jgi:hypothetical protein
MTGRVADRHQQRPVLVAGAAQGLVAPRVPVDRVFAVLAQVGGGFGSESVDRTRLRFIALGEERVVLAAAQSTRRICET